MKTSNDLNVYDKEFWTALDSLVDTHKIIIDRPKGTAHPKYKDMIYKVDYGYLENTQSMDKGGIDIYVGAQKQIGVNGIICIVDLLKGDSEIKILLGCSDEEKRTIYESLNATVNMKGMLINR